MSVPAGFEMAFTFVVLALVFLCFVKEWFPTELVALSGMSILVLARILNEKDLEVVFSNSAPLTIGAMFVLSEGLNRTGAIDWIAGKFSGWAGKSTGRVMVVLALIVMPLSAFLNNTPIVVVFLPVIMAYARTSGIKASKLLIPLSFLSILGGTMTMLGTSTNLLVAGVAKKAGQEPFGIFEITGLGVAYAVIGFVYLYLFGQKLLPNRDTVSSLLDAEDTRRFCTAVEVKESSALIGARLSTHPLFLDRKQLLVYEVIREGLQVRDIPLDALVLEAGDILWFRGNSKKLGEIRSTGGLSMIHEKVETGKEAERTMEVKTVEAIIGNKSSLIGKTVRSSNLRRNYGLVVAAVHRKGVNIQEGFQDIALAFGDTLLIEGPITSLVRLQQEEDFLSLNESHIKPPRKSKIALAAGTMVMVVLLAALNFMSISSAAIVGAVVVIMTRCVEPREAYRCIEWNILFLIYGMLAVGRAMETTGGAEFIAKGVVGLMDGAGPLLILAVIYLLASVLTELVTNNAVAILLTPVVISIAASMGVDPRPFIVAVMFGASASFVTPIGYQTNTYVYGAGGYRFGDFLKIGIPLNIILLIAAVILIPKFWPF